MSSTKKNRALEINRFKSSITEAALYLNSLRSHIAGKTTDHKFQVVLGELVKRAALHTIAIDRLADDFIRDASFKQPIFVLLRTLIADVILAMYLTDKIEVKRNTSDVLVSEEDKERFRERLEKHKWRALKKARDQFDYLKSVDKCSQNDLDNIEDSWKRNNPSLFTDDGELKPRSVYKGIEENTKNMVEGITNANTQDFAKDLYYFYFLFSQYEHFSEVTVSIMNSKGLSYLGAEQIVRSLFAILLYLKTPLAYLNLEDKSYEIGLDDLVESVGEKIENGITITY